MNLRELTIEQQQIMDALENGDFTPEQVSDHLDGIEAARDKKIERCLFVLSELESGVDAIESEIDRLRTNSKYLSNRSASLRSWIVDNMEDGEKHEYPLFKVSKVKGRQVVNITDKSLLGGYITEEVVEKLDKRTLLADLKNGDVKGAEIVIGRSSLRIK